MNRKHTAASYREVIGRIRERTPGSGAVDDIIVGFPGETEAEFVETLRMVEDIGFAQAYSFKYSPRPARRRRCSKIRSPKKSNLSACSVCKPC